MLDFEPLAQPSSAPPLQAPPPERIISKIFLNEKGLRGGWRLLIYAAFVAALGFGGGTVLQHFIHPMRGVFSFGYSLTYEVFSFLVIFGAALIMSKIEGRPPGVYGLPMKGAFGNLFWQGCLIGLIEVSALIGLISAFGGYSFGVLALHGKELLRWGMLWAVFFVFVGLFEEFLFRGYTQYTLADSIGFWPAAIVLSCSFGAVHLGNPGEKIRACTDPRKPSCLVCEFRGGYQANALRLSLRQDFAKSLECCGMRMADGHGFALFARASQRQFEFLADGRHLGDVVEERDIAEGGANSKVLRRLVSDRGSGCAAVHVEEVTVAQYQHQFVHQRSISSRLRTLMIVDAGGIRHILQELIDHRGNFGRGHAGTQFPRFRRVVGD